MEEVEYLRRSWSTVPSPEQKVAGRPEITAGVGRRLGRVCAWEETGRGKKTVKNVRGISNKFIKEEGVFRIYYYNHEGKFSIFKKMRLLNKIISISGCLY